MENPNFPAEEELTGSKNGFDDAFDNRTTLVENSVSDLTPPLAENSHNDTDTGNETRYGWRKIQDEKTKRNRQRRAVKSTASSGTEHSHHWLIEEAEGPISNGECKHCGANKDFRNWLEDTDFLTNEEYKIRP